MGIDARVVADLGPFVFLQVVSIGIGAEDAYEGFRFRAVGALLFRARGEVEIERG